MKASTLISLFSLVALTALIGCNSPKRATSDTHVAIDQLRKYEWYVAQAAQMKATGQHDAAYQLYKHAVAIYPRGAVANYEYAQYLRLLSQDTLAIASAEIAWNADTANYWYQSLLLELYSQAGRLDAAIRINNTLISHKPDQEELYYLLAQLYDKSKHSEKVMQTLNRLEDIVGVQEQLSVAKFRYCLSVKDTIGAFSEIDRLINKFPSEVRYHTVRGDLWAEMGRRDEALRSYQQALAIDSTSGGVRVSLARYYQAGGDSIGARQQIAAVMRAPEVDLEMKMSLFAYIILDRREQGHDIILASEIFDMLLHQYPYESDLYMFYADYLLSEKRWEEASSQLRIAVELQPKLETAWLRLIGLALEKKDFKAVVDMAHQGISHLPENSTIAYYLSIAQTNLKEYPLALDANLMAQSLVDDTNKQLRSKFYAQRADIYQEMGRRDSAYCYYEKALIEDPKNIEVMNNWAYCIANDPSGDLNKAERLSGETIKLQPKSEIYLDTYAWIYFKMKNYFLAKFYMERAMANMSEPSAEMYDHYGDILYMNQQVEKAVENWQNAADLGSPSQQLLTKIKLQKYVE